MRQLALAVLILAFGCAEQHPEVPASADSAPGAAATPLIPAEPFGVAEVLAAEGNDRVLLVERGPARHIRWEHLQDDQWSLVWESRDIYSADPEVLLADLNGDGARDLFWSLAFEELAGAMFVLQTDRIPLQLIAPGDHCAKPQLEHTKDGYLLHASAPGAYAECRDMDVTICTKHFDTEIPRTFRLVGTQLVEVPRSIHAEQLLAERFRAEAKRADSLISAQVPLPSANHRYSDVCEPAFPRRLNAVADSLSQIRAP